MVDTVVVPAAVVPVKSDWYSKIQWTQVVAGAAMLLAYFTGGQLNMDAQTQSAVILVIGFVGQAATFIFKKYFTKTVSPASVEATTTTVVPTK